MSDIKAIVLAAGKGTRLQTEGCSLPKVMRRANGQPLLHYVLKGLSFIKPEDTIIVVGYKKEEVTGWFKGYKFAFQEEQLGTGHAVMSAEEELKDFDGPVLVCCGDMPLITEETYKSLAEAHAAGRNACTVLAGVTEEKLPYGRIVRDGNGDFLRMVEERDCTPEELMIKELNSGVYVFESGKLFPALRQIKNNNAQGEYYLTDVPEVLRLQGDRVGVFSKEIGKEIIGVNTIEQLAEVEEILKSREK